MHLMRAAQDSRRAAFTMVEIMMVVVLIAMLVAIGLPAFLQYRNDSQDALYTAHLRIIRDAVKSYNIKSGGFPPEVNVGVVPYGVTNYLEDSNWANGTPIGGLWDYDEGLFGVTCGISVVAPDRTVSAMLQIDGTIDDGDLSTGYFRSPAGGRYMFIIEP